MRKRLSSIFFSPYFLTLVISLIVFLFIPKYTQEFDIKVTEEENLGPDYIVHYLDLDSDGLSEKILQKHYQSVPVVEIFNNDGSFYNNWNQKGKRACRSKMMYGDLDGNGYLELFVFTEENDSIYINCFEPLNRDFGEPIKMAICKINKNDDRCDYIIDNGKIIDLNGDGNKVVVFFINTGYGLTPRNLFAVDIFNKNILKSPSSFAAIGSSIHIVDMDDDGFPEITYKTGATANVKEDQKVPYTDHSAWLMVHDHKLNFKFPPIEFPGDQRSIETVPYKSGGKYHLLVSLFDPHSPSNPQRLFAYSIEGKLITEIDVQKISSISSYFRLDRVNNDQVNLLYIVTQKGEVYLINSDFSLKKIISFNERFSEIFLDDFDGDGTQELLFYKLASKKICISDVSFKHLSEVSIKPNLDKPEPKRVKEEFCNFLLWN